MEFIVDEILRKALTLAMSDKKDTKYELSNFEMACFGASKAEIVEDIVDSVCKAYKCHDISVREAFDIVQGAIKGFNNIRV